MTLHEFNQYWLGYHDRVDLHMDMIAWHASISVSPWTKKGKNLTPDKLRGKKSSAPKSGAEVLEELKANAEKRDQDSFWEEGIGKTWHEDHK